MTELTQDLSLAQAHSLIDSYAFDLGGDDAKQLLTSWLDIYQASWIRLATIEALYLGRYKTISIEHILSVWLRLGTPNTHFTYEFERLICRKLPKHLSDLSQLSETVDNTASDRVSSYSSIHPIHEAIPQQLTHPPQKVSVTDLETLNLEKAFVDPQPHKSSIPIISALGLSGQTDWSEFTAGSTMIHQFIPLPDVSSFFNKLKTFGEERLEG